MKIKKLLAGILSAAMLASATAAFAAAPSAYDGQTYESLGYTSDDPDGQFNLAVIANGDVKIYGDAMYIDGSVYSNGTIYAGNGQGNKVDGLFISGTENTTFGSDDNNDEWTQYRTAEGFVHVNDDCTTDGINYYSTQIEHEGAILDKDTSFECAYNAFEVPEISNNLGDVLMTVYPASQWLWSEEKGSYSEVDAEQAPRTITEDTYIEKLTMNGSWVDAYHQAMIIDTTNGDVNVVINNLDYVNPSIKVVGEHEANIYINNVNNLSDLRVNYDTDASWNYVVDGSTEHTHIYLTGGNVVINASKVAADDVNVTADTLEVSGSTQIISDINSNVENFTITGAQAEVTGIVCVPNADSEVVDSGTLYGQLHTDTLTINGAGRIIWKADTAVAKSENEPTPEPVEPTPTPEVPSGNEIDLNGLGYAYIFGYEPETVTFDKVDEEGNTVTLEYTPIYMAPDDSVTREQVAAMLMRMIDQTTAAKEAKYTVTPNIEVWANEWFARGYAYLAGKGAFDGIDYVGMGPVTRGEVAKLVAYGLNLSKTTETAFADIEGNEYKQYIEIVNAYGYMNGTSDTGFEPNRVMTRAEFCKMFNNIIGREAMGLTTADGKTVTAEDYSIVDIAGHWAEETMLKATSAYDDEGNVDFAIRLDNIRNKLDNYDSQLRY